MALSARPEEGEGFVAGDVVNTASRLQAGGAGERGRVAEQTYRQTERVFEFEALEPVVVKGKAEPLAIHRPLRPRARLGSDVTRTHAAPLVGRELERPLLIGTFERSAQQRSCQLVSVVGEPGVGKSRLCAELFGYLEDRPGLVRWRQGRCLPYGEGIAFWALGEVVKAECGILESDSAEAAAAKLERALPAGDPDLAWLRARLAPLVGAGGEPAAQEESFTAWRRVLGWWAEGRETGAGVRGSPLGRPGPAGVSRASRGLVGGSAAASPLHRPPRALRAASGLRGDRPQCAADQPRPAERRGDRVPDLGAAGADRAPGTDAAGAAGALGRKPLVR